ncbi:hypothetical protein [Anaerocolumna sp. MB42-C2]|uniref:hypothetical protein n=1 Tax=Anaerocolumna sp. MB42-C2 TaxID=3070997 RepID=UPI0027DFEC87|nr:hypothetical protein [Anaerocolumna sp. MB42-C2]WMJ90285.1 hypothetical protein RBU59_12365 [Anaerocolumna sp. MB42-C2]
MRENLNLEWMKIIEMKNESPYVFRTRLERTLNHSLRYAKEIENKELEDICDNMKDKLRYISDQSNQTSDGMLNSYVVLQEYINEALKLVS